MNEMVNSLQPYSNTNPNGALAPGMNSGPLVHVSPNRLQIDDRFPSLSFIVQTNGLSHFEVLVTVDRGLFSPIRESERNAGTFYSSRQDSGLIDISRGQDTYLLPQAVLQSFAPNLVRPRRIFFTAIAYVDDQGNAPQFAHPPHTLPGSAPFVDVSESFTGATISQLLGVSLASLRTIGANGKPVTPKAGNGLVGGLPIMTTPDSRQISNYPTADTPAGNSDDIHGVQAPPANSIDENGQQAITPPTAPQPDPIEQTSNGEDTETPPGTWNEVEPQPAANGRPEGNQIQQPQTPSGHDQVEGPDVNQQPNVADQNNNGNQSPQPSIDIEYDDGFGEMPEVDMFEESEPENSDFMGYGDDDFGILPGQFPSPGQNQASAGAQQPVNHNGQLQQDGGDIPSLDDIGGVMPQSLQMTQADPEVDQPVEESDGESANQNQTSPGATSDAQLDDAKKRMIIERVGELGRPAIRYDALNLDGAFRGRSGKDHPYYQRAHAGLSFGIAQFNQDSGQLGLLLSAMQSRDPIQFEQVFGGNATALVGMTNATGPNSLATKSGRSARVQALEGKDLWEEPWVGRFRAAGEVPVFAAAQNQVAAELFLDPIVDVAKWLGINSERGLALLYERAINQQPLPALTFFVAGVSSLNSEALRLQALDLVMSHNPAITNLSEYQQSIAGLEASGEWDSRSIAALHGSLRGLGEESPIVLKNYVESMTAIGQAATAQPFAANVQQILTDDQFGDDLLN